jgi:hypothetical protein
MAIIKIMRTVAGEEIIGEVIFETDQSLRVRNPCQIGLVMNERGQPSINMQRMLAFSKEDQVDIRQHSLLYVTTVDSKIEMKYNEIFGNIIIAQPKIITG